MLLEVGAMLISDLEGRKGLLLACEADIESIREAVRAFQVLNVTAPPPHDPEDYDGFLVRIDNGDYMEIWGYEGTIPYLDKHVTRLV